MGEGVKPFVRRKHPRTRKGCELRVRESGGQYNCLQLPVSNPAPQEQRLGRDYQQLHRWMGWYSSQELQEMAVSYQDVG